MRRCCDCENDCFNGILGIATLHEPCKTCNNHSNYKRKWWKIWIPIEQGIGKK